MLTCSQYIRAPERPYEFWDIVYARNYVSLKQDPDSGTMDGRTDQTVNINNLAGVTEKAGTTHSCTANNGSGNTWAR